MTTATVNSGNMVLAGLGTDTFTGGMEAVDLTGGAGNDTLTVNTFTGNARFDGAGGDDTLQTGTGSDELVGGPGVDSMSAGDGADTVHADDQATDTLIACGDGTDTAFADPEDTVESDCETVTRVVPGPGPGPGPGSGGGGSGTGSGTGTSGGAGGPVADLVSPSVASLLLGSKSFRAAASGGSIAAAVGTRVTYSLSEPATARFTVERAAAGRRLGRRCVAPTRRNRSRRSCTRYLRMKGSFTHAGQPGANSFRFTGRLRGKKLRPGRYRLVMAATDDAGNRSAATRVAFRIVRR